ncbi:hypothetical protein AC578_2422 [Pseudocercospora eumusae]|uniref:Uncharacterized protein n=1 Tax=Pseudocercospora eumusae TaxID=321146 RepID=A0A139HXP8_9PEZI|nr:hypothetical protein AC578_2422 [Pseudocercospora eumusae]
MAVPCVDGLQAGAPLGACTNGLAAPAGTGLPPNVHWMRQRCTNRTSPYHAWPNEDVCGQCYDITTGLGNATSVYDALTKKSPEGRPDGNPMRAGDPSTRPWPTPVPEAGGPWFAGFWTRLCKPCERLEQEKFFWLIFDFNLGLPSPPWAREVWNYPFNLCTCVRAVGWPGPGAPPVPPNHQPAQPAGAGAGAAAAVSVQPPVDPLTLPMGATGVFGAAGILKERYCMRDHGDVLNALLNAKRNNDDWLRTLGRTTDGRLCRASNATKRRRNRNNSSSYRACHCGGDADVHPHEAEVLLCMGCGNMRCLVEMGTAGSRYPRPLRSRRTRGQTTTNGPQPRGAGSNALGRPRGNFVDNRA